MKETLYIIPGLGETCRASGYRKIIMAAKKAGYSIVPVKINWKQELMTDFIRQAETLITKDQKVAPTTRIVLLGFSFGAFIASILARDKKFPVSKLILCSLSPYFKEDLSRLGKAFGRIGKKKLKDLSRYSFPKNLRKKTFLFVGGKEHKIVRERAMTACESIRGVKKLIVIKSAVHDISKNNYAGVVAKTVF